MSDQPTSREALYARIRRAGGKDNWVWEEMVRLGFWPRAGSGPNDLATEMSRRAELRKEVSRLRQAQARLHDEAKVLAEVRKARMAESRQKRAETKARIEADKVARAAAWAAMQATEIVYLGPGVSKGLSDTASDSQKLQANALPVLDNASDIAQGMGITLGRLRWLSFSRAASQTTHWVRFRIPKKTGGERLISAPMPHLKSAQNWVLHNVLYKLPLHDAAHGFVPGRSIVSNARPHVGRKVVINLDLQNFFPTVTYPRVWGLFRSFGYSQQVATVLALLCTEPPIDEVVLDGQRWYVTRGQRVLPQGAPTSPAVTNLLCRALDRKLTKLATAMGFTYTRYADDLTFSSDGAESESVGKLLRRVRFLIHAEGFVVHPDKTRVHRRGRRQEVTGITVNDKLGVERKTLRRFRALLHQIEKSGPDGKSWGSSGASVLASITGFANFVYMVDPDKGRALKQRVAAVVAANGGIPAATTRPASPPPAASAPPVAAPTQSEPEAAEGEGNGEKKGDWWKLW